MGLHLRERRDVTAGSGCVARARAARDFYRNASELSERVNEPLRMAFKPDR